MMKVIVKIITSILIFFTLAFILFFIISSNSNYKVDKEVSSFYKENKATLYEVNKEVLNRYKDEIYFDHEFSIKDSGLESIEKVYVSADCITYPMDTNSFYQNGLLYSKDNKPVIAPVFTNWQWDLESEKFRCINKNTYVLGKKNNGTDWYMCSYLGDGWFYYEIHSDI